MTVKSTIILLTIATALILWTAINSARSIHAAISTRNAQTQSALNQINTN